MGAITACYLGAGLSARPSKPQGRVNYNNTTKTSDAYYLSLCLVGSCLVLRPVNVRQSTISPLYLFHDENTWPN
eukprot:scaffold317071_cov22-Prasinocladus_malaysianus.AAC.1